MLRLLMTVLAEAIVGLVVGGVLLAMAVPVLNHYGRIASGDLAGAAVITLVLVGSIGMAIFRPGSAMRRYFRH